MNILFTICGRAGSKGVKNKNLKSFLEYPLVHYTLSAIDLFMKNNGKYTCTVALNTDSKDLVKLCVDNTAMEIEVVERNPILGGDTVPKVSVISESYGVVKKRLNKEFDFVIDLDITSPLRTLQDVENLVNKRISSDADVVFSVTNSRRNPFFNMVKETENGYERVIKSDFNTRQSAPVIYDMNASMYAYTPSFLNAEMNIFDGKCDIIKMEDTAVLDIDSEEDFELMEVVARYYFNKNINFKNVYDNIKYL